MRKWSTVEKQDSDKKTKPKKAVAKKAGAKLIVTRKPKAKK
jgi:hypothetical protein